MLSSIVAPRDFYGDKFSENFARFYVIFYIEYHTDILLIVYLYTWLILLKCNKVRSNYFCS